jgi:hypothetical protein
VQGDLPHLLRIEQGAIHVEQDRAQHPRYSLSER